MSDKISQQMQLPVMTALIQTHPTGHNVAPTPWSCRLVYVTSYLTAVVLFAAYSGTFVSFLTTRCYQLPFTDFQGLLSNGKYQLGIQLGSSNTNYFQVIIHFVHHILKILLCYVHLIRRILFFRRYPQSQSVTASYSLSSFKFPLVMHS
jgi:heme A synthase